MLAHQVVDPDLRLESLTWHDADQLYYSIDGVQEAIIALTPNGAIDHAVRLHAPVDAKGLAVHPITGQLVALDGLGRRVVEIDRDTGALGVEEPLDRADLSGLEAWGSGSLLSLDLDDNLMPLFEAPGRT